jgi:alpha-glucosidase
MKQKIKLLSLLLIICLLSACNKTKETILSSPNGKVKISFNLKDGKAYYAVTKDGETILNPSQLGFTLNEKPALEGPFEIKNVTGSSLDETWQQPWGEEIAVRNHYNELKIELQEKEGEKRLLNIVFRAFDDGIGFRYEFPEQPNLKQFEIADELTEFSLTGDPEAWSQHFFDRDYEQLYHKRKISEITDTVSTPVTIETADNQYIAIHEAALIDYPAMNLSRKNGKLSAALTPWASGVKVYASTPFCSPWRTVILAKDLNELVNSRMMLNLNEPSKIADTEWIKPSKYIGIWWGMHMETMTWTAGPKHGATTQNMKHYIDFAAANDIDGVLVEGWNLGWEGYMVGDGTKFRFATPYPDFDIEKIAAYAKEKGVAIIGHNETAGAIANYESQLDSAFLFAQKYGIHYIKTGYVNFYLDGKEHHSSQFGVRHYRKVVETAAKYGINIDCHEPIMPTGWQRTYPNLMAQEGARGQEWDAWDANGGNPPEHTTILPFTRGLAGPIDFTPGTFNFSNPIKPQTRVQTTLAKQLALYVVIYSPLQMASDLPENYTKNPESFEFIKILPVDWQKNINFDG